MISAIGSAFMRSNGLGLDSSSISSATSSVTGASNASAASSATAGADFGSAMAQVAQDAMSSLKTAETTSIQGINGQASTQAVVDAVMGAERTLQTAVAIRDKVVSSYLEISRMAI